MAEQAMSPIAIIEQTRSRSGAQACQYGGASEFDPMRMVTSVGGTGQINFNSSSLALLRKAMAGACDNQTTSTANGRRTVFP